MAFAAVPFPFPFLSASPMNRAVGLLLSFGTKVVGLCVVLVMLAVQSHALTPDGFALLEFKEGLSATDGLLQSWKASDASPCGWEGIQCTDSGHVDSISVKSLRGGVISPSLGRLQFVRIIDLESGNLRGQIPSELANCIRLETLNLMNNALSGKLPGELGNLTALTKLLVSRNSLEGEIPGSIAASPRLSIFNLSENLFSGRVPKALYNNLNLQVVNVGENRFTGDITADLEEMSKLPNIWGIQMNANHFTGSLPPSIGNLSSLQYLDLSFNNLDGTIPESIANCSSLQYLVLSSNNLTGSIPRTIGQCSNLEFVNLGLNYLSGDIPAEIGNCTKLRVLHLGGNKFRGKLKVDFSRITSSALILSISNNSFTGDINFFESIATNPNFTIVSACLNNLTGTIPANYDVKRLSKLQVLMLGYNKLEGKVPEWMWELPSLQVLDLSNNKLSGQVTSSTNFTLLDGFIHKNVKSVPHNCHKLDYYCAYGFDFYLNDRKFVVSMSYLTYLKYLDISCNLFSGIIPPSIGKLTNLSYLNLSKNAFTGVIPATIGRILNLQSLDVSHNLLTGPIPQEFAGLSQLADLKIGNNSLSGPIPRSTQLQSFSNDSFLPGNDELCNEPLARSCIVPNNDSTTTADPVNFNSDSIEDFISIFGFVAGFVVGFVALTIAIFVRHFKNHPKKKVVPADSSLTRKNTRYGAFKPPE